MLIDTIKTGGRLITLLLALLLWFTPAWAAPNDFNGDGKSDILWRRDDGLVAIWFMNGAANTPAVLGLVPTNWTIAGVGDFDHDLKSDILWRNRDGTVAVWLINGAAVTSAVVLGVVATSWNVAPAP